MEKGQRNSVRGSIFLYYFGNITRKYFWSGIYEWISGMDFK